MNGPIIFTLSQILCAILIALLIGACFGGWIVREGRVWIDGPTIGEAINRRAPGGRIMCDVCEAETPRAESLERVMNDPRNKGWTFGARDLCPKCSRTHRQKIAKSDL